MIEITGVYRLTRLEPSTTRKGAVEVLAYGREEVREDWPDGPTTLGPELVIGALARGKLLRPRGDGEWMLIHVDEEAWVRMSVDEVAQALAMMTEGL